MEPAFFEPFIAGVSLGVSISCGLILALQWWLGGIHRSQDRNSQLRPGAEE